MDNYQANHCKHNPQKYSTGATRFARFLFLRQNSIQSFTCEACGANLHIPDIYACVPIKTSYLLLSILFTTVLILRSSNSDDLSRGSAVFVLLILGLGLFAIYRVLSAVILAFGYWNESPIEHNAEVQMEVLKAKNSEIRAILLTGVNISVLYLLGIRLSFMILFCSAIIAIYRAVHKEWKAMLIGLGFAAYAVISLLLSECCAEWLRAVDIGVLVAVVIHLTLLQ